jgi:hypothetical protein
MKEYSSTGTSLSEGTLLRERRGSAPLQETPKYLLSKALDTDVSFHSGLVLEVQEEKLL